MSIKVSIVIVSYNVKDLLVNCIKPFYNNRQIQIIVVDNNSTDNTVATVRKYYPNVVLIANNNNPGFAKANNQAFKYCKGEYIYILNPDTYSTANDLMKLVEILDFKHEVGGVSPKILNVNGKVQKSCARKFPTLKSHFLLNILKLYKIPGCGEILDKILRYPYSYNNSGFIEACSGTALLIRKEIINIIGGFNQNYIHTGEDIDLMRKVSKLKYVFYFHSDSKLIHFAGQSSKQNPARTQINTYISTYKYFKLNTNLFKAYFYRLLIIFLDLPVKGFTIFFKFLIGKKVMSKEIQDYFLIYKYVLLWKPHS